MFPVTTALPPVKDDEPAAKLPIKNGIAVFSPTPNGPKKDPPTRSRGVSLTMLILENILEPGKDILSIDYLGEKYVADLLESGKIHWETLHFASPSSWAIYVKKQVDPSKKSGCGWNSVKYKGKKLDYYKSLYNKKMKSLPPSANPVHGKENAQSLQHPRYPIKHCALKEFTGEINPNTLVECENFDEATGKVQPFYVTISTNCQLLINFHCHLTQEEVVGYLGGKWDQEKQCLIILQAFPCKCRLGDQQNAAVTEEQIRLGMQSRGLFRVGWYHSHPASPAEPTLRDINCQLQYQIKFNAHNPFLGLICSPSFEQDGKVVPMGINAFWTSPTTEQSTTLNACYGVPMRFNYLELQDAAMTPDLHQELTWLVDYYAMAPDLINFSKIWHGNATYMERLKCAVFSKLPKDNNHNYLMQLFQKLMTTSQ